MREILFRGKRVDNGEWCYGVPLVDGWSKTTYIASYEYSSLAFVQQIEVIPETLGQFTGLTDKNGKRIWENDIVKDEKHYSVGVVVFDRIGNDGGIGLNGYFIKEQDAFGDFEAQDTDYDTKEKFYECNRCIDLKKLEVIGNINDNGELLTEERSDNENQ
jgi:uncharacterized phage protein (TIGR01671 family)